MILSVEAGEDDAIDDQPEKAVLCLYYPVYHGAGKALVGGEMGAYEAARGLVWVKRADGNA